MVEEGISIRELSQKTSLATTTLTSMLDRMEASGLVRRVPDAGDRRKTLLELTEKAQNLRADYDSVSEQIEKVFYKDFSEAEMLQFEAYLHRILANLEE